MVCIALSLCTVFPEIKSYYGQFSPQETCDTFAIVSTLNISFIQICGEHTTEILCSQNTLYRSCALFTTHFTFSCLPILFIFHFFTDCISLVPSPTIPSGFTQLIIGRSCCRGSNSLKISLRIY